MRVQCVPLTQSSSCQLPNNCLRERVRRMQAEELFGDRVVEKEHRKKCDRCPTSSSRAGLASRRDVQEMSKRECPQRSLKSTNKENTHEETKASAKTNSHSLPPATCHICHALR